jgi:hypothetical protein
LEEFSRTSSVEDLLCLWVSKLFTVRSLEHLGDLQNLTSAESSITMGNLYSMLDTSLWNRSTLINFKIFFLSSFDIGIAIWLLCSMSLSWNSFYSHIIIWNWIVKGKPIFIFVLDNKVWDVGHKNLIHSILNVHGNNLLFWSFYSVLTFFCCIFLPVNDCDIISLIYCNCIHSLIWWNLFNCMKMQNKFLKFCLICELLCNTNAVVFIYLFFFVWFDVLLGAIFF